MFIHINIPTDYEFFVYPVKLGEGAEKNQLLDWK